MTTVSNEDGHVPFAIVQTNVFVPRDSPVTPDAGSFGEEIVALPAISVHVPVPVLGVLPARVADVLHTA
jgi:hypothetical protein